MVVVRQKHFVLENWVMMVLMQDSSCFVCNINLWVQLCFLFSPLIFFFLSICCVILAGNVSLITTPVKHSCMLLCSGPVHNKVVFERLQLLKEDCGIEVCLWFFLSLNIQLTFYFNIGLIYLVFLFHKIQLIEKFISHTVYQNKNLNNSLALTV